MSKHETWKHFAVCALIARLLERYLWYFVHTCMDERYGCVDVRKGDITWVRWGVAMVTHFNESNGNMWETSFLNEICSNFHR